ncbi:hypothetical protein NHJ13734_009165 [Beauveria thailandica]
MASAPRLRTPPKDPEAREKGRDMEDNASRSESGEAGCPTLLSFDEMPEWFQHDNNKWILHGYRPISGSARASFRSWCHLHNETVNIYSHLIPAIVFLLGEWFILQYLASKYPKIGVIGALTIIINVHPKLQSHKYRSMRTLAFVATGISVVAPLIHGLNLFGLDLMNKKAFTYTLVAKVGCLLSGTALYVVSPLFFLIKKEN